MPGVGAGYHGSGVANEASRTTQQGHAFSQIPKADIQRSAFDRSHGLKTGFDSGFLIPILVDEALPGDTFHLQMAAFTRMTTPIFPVMDNMFMEFFFFAVPIRLIWDNWQKFCGEQTDPGDSTDFLVPVMTETVVESTLSDYFGIPLGVTDLEFTTLHHRAYNFIWNEWFRDENLQDSLLVDKDDGPDLFSDYVLQRRGKRHDYFTSCLPFAQKGTAVELPLGTSAPVTITGGGAPEFAAGGVDPNLLAGIVGGNTQWSGGHSGSGNATWSDPKLVGVADLSAATAATINQIREAFQIQRLLERDARGGSRYTEIVRSHFGVTSPDQRLQRPEFLGGGSTRINTNPVANTGQISAPIGTLAGFTTATVQGVGFMKSFVEHCVIIGLVNVRADLSYQQGLNRMFSRRTRFDYYWPALSHLGEQAVLNKEIFADGSPADELTFGFQERYSEYRYKPSQITSLMRSTSTVPLDSWHVALDFASLPVLNDVFIEDNPPIDRVIAIPSEVQFFGDFWFDYKCARPMPTFSVPGMVDHF